MRQNIKQIELNIPSGHSLIHLGSLDSFDITEGGKEAGRKILDYLDTKDELHLRRAIDIYEELIPNENFGGEYTALEWLCKLWTAPEEARAGFLSHPEVESFYELLSQNDFYHLKWYINRKYHFIDVERKDSDSKARLRFLEDFILFCNPDRNRWEKTTENMRRLPLKQGMHIADVGAGPGYFSFKFAGFVGEEGTVYAVETNPRHLDYLRGYIQKYGVSNVEVVEGCFEGIGLPEDVKVDMIFICSLYHNVYAAFTDEERESFIGSIRRALKPGGFLVIVDNDLVTDSELPYHGPYISKELLLSQLYYYGFEKEDQFQFTPQRYVLIFKKCEAFPQPAGDHHVSFLEGRPDRLVVKSPSSLVRYRIIGTSTSGFTWRGKKAAILLEEGLKAHDREKVSRAADAYRFLMDRERIGDEYTALLWFCQMVLASGEEREEILKDPLVEDYHSFFAGDDFRMLKLYLANKYDFNTPLPRQEVHGTLECQNPDIPIGQINEWSEFLTFNNPNRCLWERTEEMLDYLEIREGETVADIGCGSGYFSWCFSKRVGEKGRVYATEVNQDALRCLERLNARCRTSIVTRTAALNDVCLEENSVDTMFLCSMYHAVYIASIEFVKNQFIESMRLALRPGGRLYVVDNDITPGDRPAYFGPGIVKELVIAQLKAFGFELEDYRQFVPQRYVLRFRNVK